LLGLALLLGSFGRAQAQTQTQTKAPVATATIEGLVVDARNALPVSGATVVLSQGDATPTTAVTDANGRYTIGAIAPGVYTITIGARGYAPSESDGIALVGGSTSALNAALTATTAGVSSALHVIGTVSSSSKTLAAATTISQSIDMQTLTATGQIRVVDQLSTLPAINYSTSSSVADDVNINLRGLGVGETAALLDGHPIGPLGAGISGSNGGFDWSLGPAFGLSKLDVTYGSGAQGLYGSDTIGGAVNMLTINPTPQLQGSFQQQLGGFGISSTGVTATGTYGKLGFALAAGRLGEYGDFYPGEIAQTARPNNVAPNSVSPNGACSGQNTPTTDVSACNLAVNTYNVSQDTLQTMGLAKLTYAISPVTNVKVTAYNAVQWSDSTGNGDNDFLPYDVRLGQIQSGSPTCTAAGGVPGYLVTTNPIPANPTQACYTAQQYAAATSGPDGGGAGRDRGVQLRDYSLLASTQAGPNTFTFSAFADNYTRWKNSAEAGGEDAAGIYLGSPTYALFYRTDGFVASDELLLGRNDLSFGYSTWWQYQQGIEDDYSCSCEEIPSSRFGENSFFVRDNYSFSNRLAAFVNGWVKYSSVSNKSTFDPRATLQYRPTSNDVVQLTYGRSDGAPSPQLKLAGAAEASNPGASLTSVSCSLGFNSVTTAGNPALQSEGANDLEIGIGHRFSRDSDIQVNGYVTAVQNQLFNGLEPLTQYGVGNVQFAPGTLQTYLNRLQQECPGDNITMADLPQYLAVSTTYNAAHALARGIEITGRQHLTRPLYIDYGYYIESSIQSGLSDALLATNPNVLNGSQVMGVPLHTATISVDYAPGPWEFRVDNYYTEFNNGLDRSSYWHSNAFVSRSLGKGTLLTLGGTNVFNQAVQVWGYLGKGTVFPQNTPSIASGAVGASEEFGLAPAQVTFTLQQKI
jgi:outer membrane receptor protein involved in Fe transport